MRGRPRPWPVAVGALAVAGMVLRVVVLRGRWGTLDSDEAVVGLMARDLLDGEWRAFYWGQHYAGTVETALVALLGASTAALKWVPIGLSAVAALLTWRVGRRMVEERLAQAAGLLVWVAPGAYVWWSTKERGFYWSSLVLGLVLVVAAQRLVTGGGRWRDGLLFGMAAGLGFWVSPTVVYFAVPAGLWVVARRSPPVRWLVVAGPAAVVSALPWLVHNLGHGFPSLDRPPQPEHVGYLAGIGRLLWRVLPIALNLRHPGSERWLVPGLAALVYLGVGVALAVAVARRQARPVLLLAVLAAFPFLYAPFPGAWFVGDGRYALFAAPFLALAVAWLVRRPPVVLAVAAVSVVVSLVMIRPLAGESPRHLGADLAALRRAGVDHVWADYWIAYRLAFTSGGWLVASSARSARERSVHDAVAADPTPAFLYPRSDRRRRSLEAALTAPHRLVRTPHFDVVVVTGRSDPELAP
jgi:hypothetical protein